MRGPYQKVNAARANEEERVVFYAGLIKDRDNFNGHFQFIVKSDRYFPSGSVTSDNLDERTGDTIEASNVPAVRSPDKTLTVSNLAGSPSPLKIRRSQLIRKYLRSPSAKVQHKEDHCQFCDFIGLTGSDLEDHLNQSTQCRKYYLRNFKQKNILPILVKEFNCIFCNVAANVRTINHLKKNATCRNKYMEKLDVHDMKNLQDKLVNLRKQLKPSAVNRKLEFQKFKMKREDEMNNRTERELLNIFKTETSFANYACCYKCNSNLTIWMVEEVKVDDSNKEEFLDNEVMSRRRFQKYYICGSCKTNKKSTVVSSMVKMSKVEEDMKIVLFPSNANDENDNNQSSNYDGAKQIKCLMPCSVECLDNLDLDLNKVGSRQGDIGIIYKLDSDLDLIVKLAYENLLNKYKCLKQFGDWYQGVIRDEAARILSSASKVINDSVVVGSESWRRQQANDLIHRLDQLGAISLFISISLPLEKDDILATVLVQEGHCVTVRYSGDASMEMETHYSVHLNHSSSSDCVENCQKISLQDYLEDTGFDLKLLKTKYLSTYLSSVQSKFNSFLRNMIKAKGSGLCSERFYFQFKFEEDHSIKIQGIIWPNFLDSINKQFSSYPDNSLDDKTKQECLQNIDSLLCASSDERFLMEKYSLSESQAKDMSRMICKYQYHHCDDDSCQRCKKPQLPSLRTLFMELAIANQNATVNFVDWMIQNLKQLSPEELNNLSTEDWLKSVFNLVSVSYFPHRSVSFETKDDQSFHFDVDDRLQHLIDLFRDLYPDLHYPLMACYHYSITTTLTMNEAGGVMIKRVNVRDSFVAEFHVVLLKAFASAITVKTVNGFNMYEEFKTECSTSTLNNGDERILMTHQEVSLTETLVLYDQKISRSHSSNPVEFLAAFKERKKFFKKIKKSTDKSFTDETSKQIFEPQLTMTDRFFLCPRDRNIVCAEFVMNYEYPGIKESKDLNKLFSRSDVVVQDSDIKTAFSENHFLPEILKLSNGDMMKIRNQKKVIAYPSSQPFSMDFKHRKVIMFSPEAVEDMTDERVEELFYKKDEPVINDEYGQPLTIVNRIERYEFK